MMPTAYRDVRRLATYTRECTVVPDVSLMGEAIADETRFSTFGILLDGIKEIGFGNLIGTKLAHSPSFLSLSQHGIGVKIPRSSH